MSEFVFSPNYAIAFYDPDNPEDRYSTELIRVELSDRNGLVTEEDWNAERKPSYRVRLEEDISIDERLPITEVWCLDRKESKYRRLDRPMKLIKICARCQSDNLYKYGRNRLGNRRWKCRDCGFAGTGQPTGRRAYDE